MRQFNTPAKRVHSLRFAPDGRSIYLISADVYITPESMDDLPQHAYRLDLDSSAITGDWPFEQSAIAVLTPDCRSLYRQTAGVPYSWRTDPSLRRLDLEGGTERVVFGLDDPDGGNPYRLNHAAFTPDEHVLSIGVPKKRWDGFVYRLDLWEGTELEAIETEVACLAYSLDGQLLATGGPSGLRVWSGAKLIAQWGEPARVLAWAPDGLLAWAGGEQISFARSDRRDPLTVWAEVGGEVSGLAFTPRGGTLLAGSRSGLCALHDPLTGRHSAVLDWGIGAISRVAFSPDGMTCAAGGDDGQLVVWDVDV